MFASLLSLDAPGSLYTADPVVPNHPLNQGRVGWWLAVPPLEGGRQWFDIVGQHYGTLTSGPAWVGPGGRPGGYGALNFAGGSSYVQCGTVNAGTSAITVACWIYPRSTGGGGFARVIQEGDGNPWALFTSSTNQLTWDINTFTDAFTVTYNVWSHVACTYNGSNKLMYVNGSLVNTGGGAGGAIAAASTMYIGNRASQDRGLDGLLDDVTVYNRALSAAEVRTLYNQSRWGHPDTLRWLGQRTWFPPSQAAGGAFQPAWANGSNQWIGPGVWTC